MKSILFFIVVAYGFVSSATDYNCEIFKAQNKFSAKSVLNLNEGFITRVFEDKNHVVILEEMPNQQARISAFTTVDALDAVTQLNSYMGGMSGPNDTGFVAEIPGFSVQCYKSK